MSLTEWLKDQGACTLFLAWLRESGAEAPAEAVRDCPRGDWLLWVARQLGYDPDELAAAARPTRLRAVREYAPAALDAAGLHEHAARLRALPDDVSLLEVASRAAALAEFAADELWYRSSAARWAKSAASCAYAASGTSAALAAGWAAGVAECAARPKGDAAARAAFRAEHARCADEVRRALLDLASRWRAALEAAP